ncbi:glycosyl transferase [Catellatospora methionotrophica]|uniref:Glycosyl transferase n=1 Tax=Catellatospora methionotrophica TaxID=121620 RepID=A0A8J3LKP5_9ACTN|nr:nucleotide disphospho-sugar-binding domain-containing protein [Catellatospora methionotrophica]GIG14505.1 glycosyl transferase [Catellatospora methionotrophica]
MTSYLFVTWDGGGNVPPALGIAAELQRRGNRVRVLGHAQQQAAVQAAGLPFEPYRHATRWSASAPASTPAWAWKYLRLCTDRRGITEVRESLRREPAEVAVVDCMMLGAIHGAQLADVHQVTLTHTLPEYLDRGLDRGPIGKAGRLLGLSPRRLWGGAQLELVATLAELAPGTRLAANARYTGPVWTAVPPVPVPPAAGGTPAILVSLSSIYYVGQTRTLRSIVEAVADLPVRVVLTTGHGVRPADLTAPANVEVHQYLPHSQVLPHVQLVVGHGGHATTMQALAHDLPLVLMPMSPLADQPLVARAVAEQGAGLVVSRSAPPAVIRAAIERLLADGPHRAAAARLGAQIRAVDGAVTAADLLEESVAGRRPR